MGDKNPVKEEVKTFDKHKLKKTNTNEKNHIPTQAEIDEEKKQAKENK